MKLNVTWCYMLASTLALASSDPALAWGRVGHAVIASRAEAELTPQARARLTPLLDALGVQSIAQIASWTDERRTRASARWHYVDMPADSCVYVRSRDCPDDQCLVEVVKQRILVLADRNNPVGQRAESLVDVVHLAGGDSSQPLHSGMAADKGGNQYQIQVDGRGSNLHAFYDSGLLKEVTHARSDEDQIALMSAELDRVAPAHRPIPSLRPEAWIEESCRVAHSPGLYPADHTITPAYINHAHDLLDAQLILGGDELAAVLNRAL